MRRPGLTLILLALALPAHAQNPADPPISNFKQLISGTAFPATLKIKTLNADTWRRFSIPASGDSGNVSLLWFAAIAGGGGNNEAPASDDTVYYTQGNIATVGGETFLVAYRPQLKQPNLAPLLMNPQQMPKPETLIAEKITPETSVALALLNVRALKNISSIQPFDLQQEIATSAANAKATLALLEQTAAAANPPAEAIKQPLVAPKVRDAINADKLLKAEGIGVVEEENLIRLQGAVRNETLKKHAEEVTRKVLKDRGIGFQVVNELTVNGSPAKKSAPEEKGAPRAGNLGVAPATAHPELKPTKQP